MKKIFLLLIFAILIFASCKDDDEPETLPSNINKTLLLQLVNEYRTNGCDCGPDGYFPPTTPVVWNEKLEWTALDHSNYMNQNNSLSHTGSDGSNVTIRATKRGYNWLTISENIARGNHTEQSVIQAWISSGGHCSNIMNPNFKDLGVAKVGNYWTQVLGSQK